MVKAIEWRDGKVVMIDQRALPHSTEYVTCSSAEEVAHAIRAMVIRGAPAIGIAAAYGMALAARGAQGAGGAGAAGRIEEAARLLGATRPTAVNLFWALERMRRAAADAGAGLEGLADRLLSEARAIHDEDIAACRAIGRHGAALLEDGDTVLTHCNAGALATGGYGTALGVIRAAVEAGKRIRVLADETRPYLQGARLTAYELAADGIAVTVICDNMAGALMARGEVSKAIVGADRIAANGDVANKIGTYTVAVLAGRHSIPFYVAAPVSTLDLSIPDGSRVPIEERAGNEVTHVAGHAVAPESVKVRNPAFDVTPHELVTAIVTERGVAREPYGASLAVLANCCPLT